MKAVWDGSSVREGSTCTHSIPEIVYVFSLYG